MSWGTGGGRGEGKGGLDQSNIAFFFFRNFGIGIGTQRGKFLRHFWSICTVKSFLMKKFERSDDSKLHPCIGRWWLLTATKNN